MNYIKTFIVLMYATIFARCNSGQEKPEIIVQKNNDSMVQQAKSIEAYKVDLSTVEDSIVKYGIDSQIDTCLKIIYTMYCQYKFADRLWCSTNDKTIGESRIAPTFFDRDSLSRILIGFKVFFNDSIPCNETFEHSSRPMLSAFQIEASTKKIIEGIYGQYTKIQMNNLGVVYDSIQSSSQFKEYLKRYEKGLHPNFKRLL